MQAALTLINIYEQDVPKVGLRAVDLARIAQAKHPVPLTFVIPCTVFEEFMSQSGIKAKLPMIYGGHPATLDGFTKAYHEIEKLFKQVSFSGSLREELIESYESLAVPLNGQGAENLVGGSDPKVNLLASPTYQQHSENIFSLVQNVKGEDQFIDAIKQCWLSLFLPEAVLERQDAQISSFSTGVIVQQQLKGATVEGHFDAEKDFPIVLFSYRGLIDKEGEIQKDEYLVKSQHLEIVRSLVRQQAYRLIGEEKIRKEYLQKMGSEPAADDKEILEAARLTKRIHILLSTNLQLYLHVGKTVSVLFCLRKKGKASPTMLVPENTSDQQVLEEVEEYDPDSEDLGLIEQETVQESVADNLPAEHAPISEPVDDVFEEVEAAKTPVEIVDTPEPEVQTYSDESVIPDPLVEAPQSQLQPIGSAESDGVQEPKDYEQYQAESSYQEEQAQANYYQGTSSAVDEKEETLFDLFTNEQTQGQRFVIESANKLRSALEQAYQERFGSAADNDEELVDRLIQEGLMKFEKVDVIYLFDCAKYCVENEPDDEHIGVAWRLSR